MVVEVLKSIAVLNLARDAEFIPALIERLKEQHGSAIHMYVGQRDQVDFYRHNFSDGLFDSINLNNSMIPTQFDQDLDEEDVTFTALQNEAKYGTTINKLIVGHRHFGYGFALGGPHFPRSRQSELTSHIDVLDAFNKMFAFWEGEIANKSITLMINPGTAHEGCVARRHGIPMRVLGNSKVKNLRMWAHDERHGNPRIKDAYNSLGENIAPIESLNVPKEQMEVENVFLKSRLGLLGFARTAVQTLRNHTAWRIKGMDKARMYYQSSEIRMAWRFAREYKRFANDPRLQKLADLKGKRFVFFPLGVEPELAINVGSPEYFYQHAAIAAVARDLPANMVLAVKEHALGIGRRPRDFYQQLHDLKNVIMLDLSASGVEIIQQAEAVVTIRGSSGLEAAILGRPVITFGRQNLYDFLPHAHVVTDEAVLPGLLKDIADRNFDVDKMRQDGARFAQAMVDVSFRHDTGWRDKGNFDGETVEIAYQALIESLKWEEGQVSTQRVHAS